MTMQPGLSAVPYGQSIGSFPMQSQPFGPPYSQPLGQVFQTLQFLPYQLQQLQQIQLLQHQQVQQLLQIVPAQLQQLSQSLQYIAQQIPSLQSQAQFTQSPWAGMPQTAGAGFGTPFHPSTFVGQFGQGQVM
jgi:hypothetical protein